LLGDVELVVVDDAGALVEAQMIEIAGKFVDDVELGETGGELASALGDVDGERVGHCDASVCADHGDDGDDGEEVVEVDDDASIGADNRMVDDERWVELGGAELELADGAAALAEGRSLESGAGDGEPSVEEQMTGSCGVAPLAGRGQSLDDFVVAEAYGLAEFGDGQRVGDVRYDVAFGHVAVERNEIGDDHWIEAHAIESADDQRFDGAQLVEERMTECSLVGHG
jgi:hypothetical protein